MVKIVIYSNIVLLFLCYLCVFCFGQFQEKRIYAVHDTPHILKNIRNTLKHHDIEYEDGKVTFKHLSKL